MPTDSTSHSAISVSAKKIIPLSINSAEKLPSMNINYLFIKE
ncbi:hypothetical protein [Citrobacter pasteurii]|nr:hypothetical protein SF123566_5853 [Shigella flexneri 1235-66]CEJ67508.1 hypothetical protein [Citrobacter pasteurii]